MKTNTKHIFVFYLNKVITKYIFFLVFKKLKNKNKKGTDYQTDK